MHQLLGISEISKLSGRGGSTNHAAILGHRVDLLYHALPLSQAVALAVAFILFSFNLSQGTGTAPTAWFAFLVGTLVIRMASAVVYRYRRGWLSSDSAWLGAFRVGALGLSHENADLVAELGKERRRLASETETMIGNRQVLYPDTRIIQRVPYTCRRHHMSEKVPVKNLFDIQQVV